MDLERPRRLLGALLLAVALTGAGAATALATASLIKVSTAVSASSGVTNGKPATSYGRLVWLRTVGTTPAPTRELMLKDMKSGETTTLASVSTADGDIGQPTIHYNKVVYAKRESSSASATANWDVFEYNLDTHAESQISTNSANQTNPDVYGDWIVYQDDRNGNADIYLYDLREQRETQLTSSTAQQTRPSVGYNSVVYEDNRNGNYDIYRSNLYDFKEQRITTNSHDQKHPSLGDGCLVFEDNRNGNWDIYLIDLWKHTEKRLSFGSGSQVDPDASAQRMVWTDKTSGRDDIVFYEMRFGTTHRLTADSAKQIAPDLAGEEVAYLQAGAIKWADLRYPHLTASAPTIIGYRGRATITGRLKTDAGTGIAGRHITIQRSVDQMDWHHIATVTTRSDGSYRYTTPALTSRTFYRVTYKGADSYLSARNWTPSITPKVYLTRPYAPSSVSDNGIRTSGYLLPHHGAGKHSVAMVCYRKEAGVWVYRATVWMTNQDYRGYTRYSGNVAFSKPGEWRIRARHSDAAHAQSYSAWRYVTVK